MDKLDTIFAMQAALNREITEKRHMPELGQDEWIQKLTLAMMSEMAELLDEVNYKWWKNPKEINQQNVREEIVDILHFFISMCLRSGMTADELFAMYMDKNKENFDRQNGLSQKPGYDVREMDK